MARCQERQESGNQEVDHDHLKWQGTRHFSTTVAHMGAPDEVIKYSGWVEKINNKGTVQPRIMVISNLAVYNFKSRLTVQCQRRIDISMVAHIIRSKYSHQFILCCPQEYDYHYSSVQVAEICEILVAVHKAVTANTITIEFKDVEDLSGFVLTRQEAKKLKKEHPELAPATNGEQNQPKTEIKASTVSTAPPAKRMPWAGDDPSTSATAKLLPDLYAPSTELVSSSSSRDVEAENIKVLNISEEVYLAKNQKTGRVFALKPVEEATTTWSKRFALVITIALFQILILCTFWFALKYIVTSCYKG